MSIRRGLFCRAHTPFYETWMLPTWLGWIANMQMRRHNRMNHGNGSTT